jgi:hypothetical protein
MEYVLARCVLLDALDALGAHCDAVVLVGAQAVYLHTGDADLAVAPTTTDADIALAPDRLRDKPLLEEALRSSGFTPGSDPGMWCGTGGVAVDIMVPEALSGSGTGAAVLGFQSMAIELSAAQPDLSQPWWTMSSRS